VRRAERGPAVAPDLPLEELPPAQQLRALGLRAQKGLSQSFLADRSICQAVAAAAELEDQDEVLEIGPGLGVLTRVLLERAGRVVAVELDPRLASVLPRLVPADGLEVVSGDALEFDPAAHFAGGYKLVANLPYQITSPVLHRYLLQVRRPRLLVLMMQREVALRIAAGPGRASYLAILVQAVADLRVVRQVPPQAFYPTPKVSSTILALRPRPNLDEASLVPLAELVRHGFTQPRKTLANSLAQGLQQPRARVEAALAAAGLEPSARPQQLSVDDWRGLLAVGRLDG
jgi:16S rRNA (adenine1518-N6/adenine1519-N6)-dimethyltransferase